MIKGCYFETPIAGSYLRNNRSTRQKSLRCFPACDPRGHIAAGFCGIPLRIRMHLCAEKGTDGDLDIQAYTFIAETRPLNSPSISSQKVVSKQSILQNVRTRTDRTSAEKGELFIGDAVVIAAERKCMELIIVFNPQHCSWDYSWKSNRWSGSQEHHVVDIIVLKDISPTEFAVCSSSHSTPFIVASSHKRSLRQDHCDAEVLRASTVLRALCESSLPSPAIAPSVPPSSAVDDDLTTTSSAGSCAKKRLRPSSPKPAIPSSHPPAHVAECVSSENPPGDKSLSEGAETLLSLFDGLAPPRNYGNDQTGQANRVARLASELGMPRICSDDCVERSASAGLSPFATICLPARE